MSRALVGIFFGLTVAAIASGNEGFSQDNLALQPQLEADIRVGLTPGRTRIVIDVSAAPQYSIDRLGFPQQVLVDISNAELKTPVSPAEFSGTPISSVRSVGDSEGNLQLIVEMNAYVGGSAELEPRLKSFLLPADENGGERIVLDFYSAQTPGANISGDQPQSVALASAEPPVAADEPEPITAPKEVLGPVSGDAMISSNEPLVESSAPAGAQASPPSLLGYGELSGAYTYGEPSHWSQLRARVELGTSGTGPFGARYKFVARAEVDGAFQVEDDFYSDAAKRDREVEVSIREAYLDFGSEDWEYRLGRQHIVWGEMVGLFLADVVSAKDTREFYLVEFETMRIPQWAVRAERFAGESHFELIWVPYQSYDEVGVPGTDFFPYSVAPGTRVKEITPSRSDLGHTSIGARYSRLVAGWDLTGFYYQSNDVSPTLYTTDTGLELRHDRLDQIGTTFSKANLNYVLKGEAVYTSGRSFLSQDPLAENGLESSDALEYILGITVPVNDWRFDAQVYGRYLVDHSSSMLSDKNEFGITLLANRRFGERFEAQVLYLAGLNRSDYSVQPRFIWNVNQHWRMQIGADIFGGEELGFYGRYDRSDRISVALRRWF